VVEHLLTIHQALGSVTATVLKTKKESRQMTLEKNPSSYTDFYNTDVFVCSEHSEKTKPRGHSSV
jgi:hypothetical protein